MFSTIGDVGLRSATTRGRVVIGRWRIGQQVLVRGCRGVVVGGPYTLDIDPSLTFYDVRIQESRLVTGEGLATLVGSGPYIRTYRMVPTGIHRVEESDMSGTDHTP